MKEFIQGIINTAIYLYKEHFPLILLGILVLIIVIVFFIVLSKCLSKKKEIKVINENRKNQSIYTQKEIDNIANNVADKTKFISSIPPEKIIDESNDAVNNETAVTKNQTNKTKTKKTSTYVDNKEKRAKEDTTISQKSSKHTKTASSTLDGQKSVTETKKRSSKKDEKIDTTTTDTTTKRVSSSTKDSTSKMTTNQPESKNSTKKTTAPEVTESKPTTKKTYTGKWKIKQENSKFYAQLIASNGGILLKTETYTSMTGVKSGIETIKKNIDDGNFTISSDKYGHYRFKLFSKLNRLICISEDYSSRAKCDNAIASVKRFAKTAYVLVEDSE